MKRIYTIFSLCILVPLYAQQFIPVVLDDIVLMIPKKNTLTDKQRNVADQIISIFENGTTTIRYDYAEVVKGDEQHGITAGRLGFTSATGDMLEFLKDYYHIAPLSGYIEELERLNSLYAQNDYELSDDPNGSMNVEHLDGLIDDWRNEGNKTSFQRAQDDYLNDHYYTPALEEASNVGLELPLSLLCFYDCAIQHGTEGLKKIIHSVKLAYPRTKDEEILWIKQFNKNRLEVLKHTSYWKDSLYRVDTLNDLIDAEKYFLNISKVVIKSWENEEFIIHK